MANSQLFKVFVYGTLKIGEPNYFWLTNLENGVAKFIGEGTTVKKFPLVIGTRYNIPFLLKTDRPDTGNQVKGEVFSVDQKMLARLDILEDYPQFYDREMQDITVGADIHQCWVYLLKNFPEKLLSLPFLTDYRDNEEKRYQARSQRVSNILARDDLEYEIK